MRAALQGRDTDILMHVARYRITSLELVHKLFFPQQTAEAARSVLRRLNGPFGFLQSRPLYGKLLYYQLNPRGAREFGEPVESTKPLGPQALPRAFGVVMRCCTTTEPQKRITRNEFESACRSLFEAGVPFNDFFLATAAEGTQHFFRIVVDLGGDADRLVRKLLQIRSAYSEVPAMLSILDEGRFGFSLVTTSTSKEEAILKAVDRFNVPTRVETFVLPELGNLLPDFYAC